MTDDFLGHLIHARDLCDQLLAGGEGSELPAMEAVRMVVAPIAAALDEELALHLAALPTFVPTAGIKQ